MKINFFTPLPGERTEIANMAATLLPELGAIADVRAWTAQPEWQPGLARNYEIRRFDPDNLPVRDLNWADVTFYNIGNNALFHRAIFDVARRMPGIHILHDVRLAHFLTAYADKAGPDRDYYLSEMDQAGLGDEARRFIRGELPFQALATREPLTRAVLRPAIGGILHNPEDMQALSAATALPLFHVPLCLTTPMMPPPARPARVPVSPTSPVRIILFGFIGRNRCLPEILQALSEMSERRMYRLDIYGMMEEPDEAAALIRQHGLQDMVTEHGFVPDDQLQAALSVADLAINLRNPTMGEASASQLRIWASALASLVSDVGWYATLPSSAVFRIAPGCEVVEIRRHLEALRKAPEQYREAGQRGRLVLEQQHQPVDYARALLRIADEAPRMHARRNAISLSRRSAAALLRMTDAGQAGRLVPTIAHRIQELVREADTQDGAL